VLPGFLYDKKVRDLASQAAVVAALLALGWFFVANAAENMTKAGIASGFDFLFRGSGIEVPMHLVPHTAAHDFLNLLLVGVLNTVVVSVLGIVAATALGFLIGIARLSSNWLLAALAGAYVEIVRNIPLLLFVFFWYFGIIRSLPGPRESLNLLDLFFLNSRGAYLPAPESWRGFIAVPLVLALGIIAAWAIARWAAARQARTGAIFPTVTVGLILTLGLTVVALLWAGVAAKWDVPALRGINFRGGMVLIPEFVAIFAALVTYTAGFVAEIVRGGILAIGKGQWEAAHALGLTRAQALRLIVVPQALRVMVPPLTSQYLNVLKNSSFGAAIAYPELVSVFMGSALNATGQAIEIIAITLGIYLALSLSVSAFMNWYNARIALTTR
jgi:general L-amino acid transport system permease protein